MKRFLACALALSLGLLTLGCGEAPKKTPPVKPPETKGAAAPAAPAPAAPTTPETKK